MKQSIMQICQNEVWRKHVQFNCCRAYIFPVVKKSSDRGFWASPINIKSSMSSETTKGFRYKYHGLFVNSPVMITVKSFLTCRSMQYNITFFFYKSLSRIMAHYSHGTYACYQNMPQNLFASCSFATHNFAETLYQS